MAQGFLIGLPQRLFDSNGLPADSWQISFTNAGLGTPVTTYSNAALTSANTDPVVTDASGYYRAFVAEAVIVDIEVKDADGVTQFTLESVEAMPDTSGSSPSVTAVPTGSVVWSPYSTTPTGFLYCNGAAVNRSTYSALNTLAAADSYPNGSGDGSTTFNLPDLRGRAPYGLAASGTGSTLGETFGDIDHTHTGPSHTHTTTVTKTGWGGVQAVGASTQGQMQASDGVALNLTVSQNDQTFTSATGGTGDTGTANPPGITGYWFIKT